MSAPLPPHRGLHNQPPDPDPRTPRFPVPYMAWDCHIHLFGPATQFPFESSSPYVSDDALPEDYLRTQKVLGLRGIRVFAGPAGHEWSHLPQINPALATLVHDAGWHVQYQSLVRGHLVNVADKLLSMPTPLVIDHCGAFDPALGTGQAAFTTLLRMLDMGKVWLKLSGPMRCSDQDFPYADMLPFAKILVAHAPERLLWGSDWPHVQMNGRGMPNDGDLLDLFAQWVPDAATRELILVQNPLALYS